MTDILWELPAAAKRRSRMAQFLEELRRTDAPELPPADAPEAFTALHRWSVDHLEGFWRHVWRFCGVVSGAATDAAPQGTVGIGLDRMAPPDADLGPRWFPAVSLNYAENLLRHGDEAPAIIAWNELGPQQRISYVELRSLVSACAGALRGAGVGVGDRVGG